MTLENGQFMDNSEDPILPWGDILEKMKSKQQLANKEGFDKKAWDVKIGCSRRVLGIFENTGGKTNEQLFDELNTVIESLTSGLSQKEKKALGEVETLSLAIQKQRDIWALRMLNLEEIDMIDFHESDNEMERFHHMESELLHTKQSYGKVEFISHLKSGLSSLAKKMKTIEDFKKNGSASVKVPETIQKVIETTRHKILYSNFGIHFLVRDKDWVEELDDYAGQYYGGTPFTINKRGGLPVRDTLEHEGRHNIFNSLIGYEVISPGSNHWLDTGIQIYERLVELNAPNEMIGDNMKEILRKVSLVAKIHINKNRDEILANFEGLATDKVSTDVQRYHKNRGELRELRQRYEKRGKSLELIDMAIQIFEDEMKQFYQKMSEYLFIASRTGNLQKIRLLIYWIDLEKYDIIESYLRSEVGNDIYEACVAMRNIVNPLGLESFITGEKMEQSLSPEDMFLRAIFGESASAYENKFLEKAILPQNISSLLLYLKKYRTFDSEKQFRNNGHLIELLGFTIPNKIKALERNIIQLSSEGPQKIEQEKYLTDLIALQDALKRYRQKPGAKKQ